MKTTRSSWTLNSQLGHFAALASLRWNMPTPVALRNSSRPVVAMHFQEPIKLGASLPSPAGTALSAAESEVSGSSVERSQLPRDCWASSARRIRGLPSSRLCDQLTTLSSSAPSDGALGRAGCSAPAVPPAACTEMVRTTKPLCLFFLVRANSFRSRTPMSRLQGMATEPQSLSSWKLFLSQIETLRKPGMPSELHEKLDSHFGSL
mmetsp:Transcript_80355/g.236403  ORF Transcript_80355/g.236403 Transcript_80355/m.236403 type:complete len:206 (-) Transcript_80355:424-1041(-)